MRLHLEIGAKISQIREMKDRKIQEILAPVSDAENQSREEKVRDGFWPVFRKALRQLPFGRDVAASYYCALDPQTPTRVRMTLLAALAYFVMPLDGIPDFLMFVGFTDDIAVLGAVMATLRGHITPAHRLAADRALDAQDSGV